MDASAPASSLGLRLRRLVSWFVPPAMDRNYLLGHAIIDGWSDARVKLLLEKYAPVDV